MNIKTISFIIAFFITAALGAAKPADRIQVLCDSLTRLFPDSITTPRLAVLPFTDNTGKAQGQGVAEYVVNCLQKGKKFKLVDRMEFQKALGEIALSISGAMDSASELKVGKILSAPYILTGTISTIFGSSRITAKIIRVETSEIVATTSVVTEQSTLEGFAKDLVSEKSKISASVFRSMVAPGWGQMYTEHWVRGGVSTAAAVIAGGYALYTYFSQQKAFDDLNNFSNMFGTPAYVTYRDTLRNRLGISKEKADTLMNIKDNEYKSIYDKKYNEMITADFILVGVWALNIVDAAIAGAQSKRKFKLYFTGDLQRSFGAGVAYKF